MSSIYVNPVAEYDYEIIRKTVAGILDNSRLDLPGKTVLVKPNLLGPWGPDSAVVTHPSIIKAVREELVARECTVLVGDNPGARGYGKMLKTAEISGALEASGGDFVNLSRRPTRVEVNSPFTDYFSVSSEVFEVDYLISLPKFKSHMSTALTGAVKNSYGLLVGGEKMRLHGAAPQSADFGEMILDIYLIRPPDLVILDAVVGMEGGGPSNGDARHIGYILSSNDGMLIDLAMCHMAGINPKRVPTVRAAITRDLCPDYVDDLEIVGTLPVLHKFKIPFNLSRLDPGGFGQKVVASRLYTPHLSADKNRCTKCRTCEKSCPTRAVTLDTGYPVFNRSKCIACYCCHELCPEGAVRKGRLIKRSGIQGSVIL